ncbi:PREDICTED: proteinaceous RNase P 2-like [Tarenaya hassleriana]|uniref:proteinaceous RNase P 2-like n=1 Tax=Tarenaya hassleriana TaxID=28532 RepID=UPI00053C1DF4|nr:PREDICTED: proteinaceous RNase P 2-like [Tarenaya hassleriana]
MTAIDQRQIRHHDESEAKPNKRKKLNHNPEKNLLVNLNACSKSKDLKAAMALYDASMAAGTVHLGQQHFQTLLYLCSASTTEPSLKTIAIDRGFEIFERMVSSGITPNEASITAVVRLAATKGDGDYAFKLVRDMVATGGGSTPRLRTYSPVLFCFCEKLEAEKAYEVEEHMDTAGVMLEEAEISALLKVSSAIGQESKVYRYLHKLRECVGCVSEETLKIIEDWFSSDRASEVSDNGMGSDVGLLREAVSKNGGGWHGYGWVGEGKWIVERGNVSPIGKCLSCGEQLACVDTNEVETNNFADSLASLAIERKAKMTSNETIANFTEFQDWLERHGDYEAILDGANIGLYQQNFADGGFSLQQLEAVVMELYHKSGNKWPLVVLHKKRVQALLDNPSHRKLVEEWITNGVLYATPPGSNDDWYWLYAAVKLKCLLVTNDEMRDHIFELLGSSFFQKWKERHQVRYTFVKGNLKLEMPPPFSVVIQESEKGSWHFPMSHTDSDGSSRTWLCITRPIAQSP